MKKSIQKSYNLSSQSILFFSILLILVLTTNCQKELLQDKEVSQDLTEEHELLTKMIPNRYFDTDNYQERGAERRQWALSQNEEIEKRMVQYKADYEQIRSQMPAGSANQNAPLSKSGLVIRVPEDYPTINEALAAATLAGTTIAVSGHYDDTDETLFFLYPGITIDGGGKTTWDIKSLIIEQSNITLTGLNMNVAESISVYNTTNLKVLNSTIHVEFFGLRLVNVINSLIQGNKFNSKNLAVWIADCSEITIDNNDFQHISYNFGQLISLFTSSKNIITNNRLKGMGTGSSTGISLTDNCTQNLIKNCISTDHQSGISLYLNSNGNTISNCVTNNNVVEGISILVCSDNKIIDCTANDNDFFGGIWLGGCSTTEIINCRTQNNTSDGIFIGGGYDIEIINCKSNQNGESNLFAGGSQLIKVSNGTFNESQRGILLVQCNSSTIEGCIVNNNHTFQGIGLAHSNYNTIKNNTTHNNKNFGIVLVNSAGNDILSNSARDNTTKCDISAYEADFATLQAQQVNTFSDNKYGTFFCEVTF